MNAADREQAQDMLMRLYLARLERPRGTRRRTDTARREAAIVRQRSVEDRRRAQLPVAPRLKPT